MTAKQSGLLLLTTDLECRARRFVLSAFSILNSLYPVVLSAHQGVIIDQLPPAHYYCTTIRLQW